MADDFPRMTVDGFTAQREDFSFKQCFFFHFLFPFAQDFTIPEKINKKVPADLIDNFQKCFCNRFPDPVLIT